MKNYVGSTIAKVASKVTTLTLIGSFCFPNILVAAVYSYIDPGDVYFINDFGGDNRRVQVVRKLGSGSVKVRNLATGESFNVQASSLLTEAELNAEEMGNAVGGAVIGAAILYCIFSDECGN